MAARALVAFEQQIEVKETAEDLAKTLQNEHKKLLAKYGIEKDPLEMTDWSEDLTKWPKTNLGESFFDRLHWPMQSKKGLLIF